jgi:HSP20 family protein
MANLVPALRSSLDRLKDEIDTTFDRWMPNRRPEPDAAAIPFGPGMPVIDMEEDENEIRITAELPGLEKDDFQVELVGNRVVIRGEKRQAREQKTKNTYFSELAYGSFARSIALPTEIVPERVMAYYKNGVLKITLPKCEQTRAKSIDVQVL